MSKEKFIKKTKSSEKNLDDNIKTAAKDTKKIMEKLEKPIIVLLDLFNNGINVISRNLKKKNGKLNFNFMLEIIFKVIICIFFINLLNFMFKLAISLGTKIVFSLFLQISTILIVLLYIILIILYACLLIMIIMLIFKKQLVDRKKENSDYYFTLNAIFRIIVNIMVSFPILIINFIIVIITVFFLYLLFNGVPTLGIILILIGLSLIFGLLADLIKSFMFVGNRFYLLPFIISTLLIIVGSIILKFDYSKFTYYPLSTHDLNNKETLYELYATDKILMNFEKDLYLDNLLADGQIVIKVVHKDILNIDFDEKHDEINVKASKINREFLKLIIEDLKNRNIYNYQNIFDYNIKIYVNENTLRLIK